MVKFTTACKNPIEKKPPMEESTSGPMIGQEALKKPEVRPSGPGALFGFSLRRVLVIVSGDGEADIMAVCLGETRNVRIEANHWRVEIVIGRTSGASILLKYEIASSPIAIGSVISVPFGRRKDLMALTAERTFHIR